MVTVCQQCGDEGAANALVYCVECLDFAVHRYCLDKLAEPDEFVLWFCEDCKPKAAKLSPLDKSSSITSMKRDHLSLEDVQVTHSGIKLKKKEVNCLVAETEERRCQSSHSQQPHESCTKLDLTDHAQMAGDWSPRRIKLEKKKMQRLQSFPFQQPPESQAKHDLTERDWLVGDCSPLKTKLKKKKKKKKKSITCPLAQTDQQIHQSSSFKQPPESQAKHDLTECVWLVGDCSPQKTKWKKKRKKKKSIPCSVAETDEQIHQSSSFNQPHEAHKEFRLTECTQLASDCSPLNRKLKRKKEDVTSSLPATEKQKCQIRASQHPFEACTKVNMIDCAVGAGDYSPLNENGSVVPQCSENHGNDMKLGKQISSILEEWSKFGEEAESVQINASQTGSNDLSSISDHNLHLHAQPVIDPIWRDQLVFVFLDRGSLSVSNRKYGIFDGVAAHLSSKACSKVWKEASLLPALLCPEMLPKTDVWPKSFERSEPSDDNIALYFFAGNKSCESVFNCLVDDMVCQELAMRAMVKNAELLVFPSTELPLLYWRFQGKYYLWGVFREKQASSSNAPNHHLMVQNSSNECVVYLNSASDVGAGEEIREEPRKDQELGYKEFH
ncbi:hypothetical protein F0562_002724 [Nyssa sinensis]|uniref:AIPP2-like SPOC-like domain-containing protein n=1 Tax=Nyssa sinensis TaxID=561372 RepID=A0A5J5BXT5_9ASTE|nr:hypothetical protein F0562_002724 [Nyssa sinensis]